MTDQSSTAIMGSASTAKPVDAPAFSGLRGADGRRYGLSSFRDSPVLGLIFSGNACPTAKAWDAELVHLQHRFRHVGVQLVMINPNNHYLSPSDTYDLMVERARLAGFNFPYLKDDGALVARQLGARCTPEVYVFDNRRTLRYAGRIADSRRPTAVTRYDLQEALSELVAGKSVSVPITDPFGCALVL